jgi:hypothetical protein
MSASVNLLNGKRTAHHVAARDGGYAATRAHVVYTCNAQFFLPMFLFPHPSCTDWIDLRMKREQLPVSGRVDLVFPMTFYGS